MNFNLISYFKEKISYNPRLLLSIPYIIIAIIFIILPTVLIFVTAISKVDVDQNQESFNQWYVVSQSNTWWIMWRSVKLGFIASFICLIIAVPYAFFVSTSKSKFFQIYGISLIVSPLIIFTISKLLSLRGLFTVMLGEDTITSEWFMAIGLVFLNLPFMIIPLYTVFRDMPKNIIEASQDLGYNKFQTLIKVVLPYSLKAMFTGIGMVFLMAASSVAISDKLLPNGSQNQMIGNLINYFSNPTSKFDIATASTLVVITTIILIGAYSLTFLVPYLITKLRRMKNV
ncbi:ABC transporter permease [Mycoplasma iguanae]|uniref:ABC transporter permease n=1 Tax=Mycoplasma iguanae TaxID=292461 RepID=A0ABY5R973_9MOLU|nr:ABC transporter permease [Mycoplasma iguanae]UVD81988.1 ABC transporter permease [Mycoplasma iguanae]